MVSMTKSTWYNKNRQVGSLLNYSDQMQPWSSIRNIGDITTKAKALKGTLQLVLSTVGHQVSDATPLHSLDKGGAQVCADFGATLKDIKDIAHWTANTPRAQAIHVFAYENLINLVWLSAFSLTYKH